MLLGVGATGIGMIACVVVGCAVGWILFPTLMLVFYLALVSIGVFFAWKVLLGVAAL